MEGPRHSSPAPMPVPRGSMPLPERSAAQGYQPNQDGSFFVPPSDFRPPPGRAQQSTAAPVATAAPTTRPGVRPWPPAHRPLRSEESFEDDTWNLFSPFGYDDEESVTQAMSGVAHLRFISASTNRQHKFKTEMGMINADVTQETHSFLGLCDGVSEVQKMGIRPDEFPKDLLLRCREAFEERDVSYSSSGSTDWLLDMIEESYEQTTTMGSTTLLMAVLEEHNRLIVANLGDCCCLLLRRNRSQPTKLQIVYKTEALRFQHNKPYQIVRMEGVEDSQMTPVIESTHIGVLQAQHGDILVLGSDGVFDNLHDEDIVRIISKTCPARSVNVEAQQKRIAQQPVWHPYEAQIAAPTVAELSSASNAIVQEALDNVVLPKVDEKTGQMNWPPGTRQTPVGLGGKADDTSVIVAALVEVADTASNDDFFRARGFKNGLFDQACCGQESSDQCRCQ